MVKNIKVCERLAMNIELVRNDNEFLLVEKSSAADALQGILTAKTEIEDDSTIEKLESAIEIILSYLFYIDLFKEV